MPSTFRDPPPPSAPVDTSRDAARKALPSQNERQMTILRLLALDYRFGGENGLTADQVEEQTGWGSATVTPRMWELVQRGLIYRNHAVKLPTRRKRWAHPYKLTTAGLAAARKQP